MSATQSKRVTLRSVFGATTGVLWRRGPGLLLLALGLAGAPFAAHTAIWATLPPAFKGPWPMLASYLVLLAFSALFFGAVLAIVMADGVGTPISLGEALRRSLRRLPGLYGVTVGLGVATIAVTAVSAGSPDPSWYPWLRLAWLGEIILAVGIAAVWAPSGPALLQEGLSVFAAFGRGRHLSQGSRVTIGLIAFFYRIAIVIPPIVIYAYQFLPPGLPRTVATLALQVTLGLVWVTAEAVIYLQLRERADGLAVGDASRIFD
jgi:hypothetical protein